MKLTCSAFEHEGKIPAKYTCDGSNMNPPLKITDVPSGAKSLVLIMDELNLPEKAAKQQVEKAMEGHILMKTQLMGRYKRLS